MTNEKHNSKLSNKYFSFISVCCEKVKHHNDEFKDTISSYITFTFRTLTPLNTPHQSINTGYLELPNPYGNLAQICEIRKLSENMPTVRQKR